MTGIIGVKGNNLIIPYSFTTKQTKEITLPLTGIVSGWTTNFAKGRFKADSNGKWRMECNIKGSGFSTTSGNLFSFVGISADNTVEHAISFLTAGELVNRAYIGGNAVYAQSTTTFGEFDATITVLLQSEPDWVAMGTTATAVMEGVAAADIYIPFGQPGMPGESSESFSSSGAYMLSTLGSGLVWNGGNGTPPSLSLTKGTWMLTGQAQLSPGSGTQGSVMLDFYNATDAVSFGGGACGACGATVFPNLNASGVLSIASTKTIYLRGLPSNGSFTFYLGDGSVKGGHMLAVRITP